LIDLVEYLASLKKDERLTKKWSLLWNNTRCL